MLNNMNEFSNAVGTVVNDAVRRAMRKNSGQFEGTWEYHVITPNVAYTMPNEFVWVSTVKYTSQASVAFARRIDCNFDITIDSTHATHSSNGLPLNELDCEIFPDAQHPLYWPTPRYVQGGQRIYFAGSTPFTGTYLVLHGFRPIRERSVATNRIPFIYTMGWNNIAPSTNNIDTVEIMPNTKFVITHVISIQRVIDPVGNYMVETPDMNVDINIVNKPVGRTTANTAMLFGTPQFPFRLDAPVVIGAGNSIYINGTAPAWADGLNRDVFLYFVGIQLTGNNVPMTSVAD